MKTTSKAFNQPALRFTPYAWAKLIYLRDCGDTEISGFGVSADHDPLLITDVVIVKQRCTIVTVAFDDDAVADMFDRLVDEGFHPSQFGRIWLHTHPGDCPLPSGTDEQTFERVFGRNEWAVMGIVARGGRCYARLTFNVGPGGSIEIPMQVDYAEPFDGSEQEQWAWEYTENVIADVWERLKPEKAVTASKDAIATAGLPPKEVGLSNHALDDRLCDSREYHYLTQEELEFYDAEFGTNLVDAQPF